MESQPPATVVPADYPELSRLAWNRRPDRPMNGADALALYERNWRHVDEDGLCDRERALIAALIEHHGNGVFLGR